MNKLKQRLTDWLDARTVTWRTVAKALGIGVLLGAITVGAVSSCTTNRAIDAAVVTA